MERWGRGDTQGRKSGPVCRAKLWDTLLGVKVTGCGTASSGGLAFDNRGRASSLGRKKAAADRGALSPQVICTSRKKKTTTMLMQSQLYSN